MDYELRLIDAENTERTASLQLAAADASWREVANRTGITYHSTKRHSLS